MEYPRIALRVTPRAFNTLIDLGNRAFSGLTDNLDFSTVSPPLSLLQTAITATVNAKEAWGSKGNRGSHAAYINLCAQALNLQLVLKQLAAYVTNTASQAAGSDYMAMKTMLSGSGFELAKDKTSQGTLEAVRNFHNFITRSVNRNQLKLKWLRPLNTANGDVNNYDVYRSTTPLFSAAVIVANTTKCEFIDTNTSGASVTWYYWVVPFNPAGAGITSDVVSAVVAFV